MHSLFQKKIVLKKLPTKLLKVAAQMDGGRATLMDNPGPVL